MNPLASQRVLQIQSSRTLCEIPSHSLLLNPQQRPLQPLPVHAPSSLRIPHQPTWPPPHRQAVARPIALNHDRRVRGATSAPGTRLGGAWRGDEGAAEGGESGSEELRWRVSEGWDGEGGRTPL